LLTVSIDSTIRFVQNDLLDALELVAFVFRQMGQRLLHKQALSARNRRSEKTKVEKWDGGSGGPAGPARIAGGVAAAAVGPAFWFQL
jgi:hypothetical protein